jgi:hypothetical protein
MKSHELRLIKPQTQHKNPENMYLKFKILITTNTICGENCESLWVQGSL